MSAAQMDMEDTYTTKDLNEIALLIAYRLRVIEVNQLGAVFFSFTPRLRAIELTDSFFRGDLMGNLREFADAQRRAKDLIFRTHGNRMRIKPHQTPG